MEEGYNDYTDKDKRILEALMPYARKTTRSSLTEVKIDYATRKTSICFLMLPEWAVSMAPYNVARLSAITKQAGYQTYAFDINVAAFNASRKWKDIEYDPWDTVYMHRWTTESDYEKYIHPHLMPLMDEYIEKVVALNPTVVGFTVYECNRSPNKYMATKIKERLPDVLFAMGGPSCHRSNAFFGFKPDYIVSGEGEQLILDMLDEIESGVRYSETKTITQDISQRINLDILPSPDYSHFNFNDYQFPNGVTMEFSRGCTAKCVFCDETHFWKYRDRQAARVINEVAELYEQGVTTIWFLDSLINGNIKELRGFCKGIIASDMKIQWAGWARCDGRMDLEYYKDLTQSGCHSLAYGVESGSNKVLKDMAKGITNTEIEQNFKDGYACGLKTVVMLIFGFPTEEPVDFRDTMTLIWKIRDYDVQYVASGLGCFVTEDNLLGQNREKYNISPVQFSHSWITADFKNSKLHRLMRVKTFNIFMNNLLIKSGQNLSTRKLPNHYKIDFKHTEPKEVDYTHEIDLNICKPNISNFADSLINEIWSILYMFWKTRGAYSIEIVFDGPVDKKEFSEWLSEDGFNALIKFEIDDNGDWKANFDYNYKQEKDVWRYQSMKPKNETNAFKRIVMLSDEKNTFYEPKDYGEEMAITDHFNKTYDFSFEYQYKDVGHWD